MDIALIIGVILGMAVLLMHSLLRAQLVDLVTLSRYQVLELLPGA